MSNDQTTDPEATGADSGGAAAGRRVVLVTGAAGGIGSAVAVALAEPGTLLVLVGRDEGRLGPTVERCRSVGAGADVAICDLAQPGAAAALGAELAARFPSVDVLVHAAGVHSVRFTGAEAGSVPDFDEAAREAEVRVNQLAPQALTHALGPALCAGRADVVVVGSSAPRFPRAGGGSYAATKAGVAAWADALRAELGPSGVRVLTVWPGRTATAMQAGILADEGSSTSLDDLLQPDDLAATIAHAVGLPRTAEITELHIRPAYPPR